jgi:DNA-binding winged helix-turn-helix (wHTH) protein
MKPPTPTGTTGFYAFGPYLVDTQRGRLFEIQKGWDQPIKLPPKAFEILLVFLRSGGRVMEKDELLKLIWNDTVVEENNLNQGVRSVRLALAKNQDEKDRYIKTVPQRGFRFAEKVEEIPEEEFRSRLGGNLRTPEVVRATTSSGQESVGLGNNRLRLIVGWYTRWPRARVVVAGILAAAFVVLTIRALRPGRADPSGSARAGPAPLHLGSRPVVPRDLQHWARISLVNEQPRAIPGPFQQLIIVNSTRYTPFESDNLMNVEFFDEHGTILRSWLESGNSNLSDRTVYWIQLPEGLAANKTTDIYMGFAPKDRTVFNTSTTGEAPGLSSNYGEYDNGFFMFPRYANFAGNSLPQGWYSGTTPGGHGSVRISDGVFISHSGMGGGSAFLGSDWAVGDNVAEMNLLTQVARNAQEMILVCSANPTHYRWRPFSVAYQNMSGLEVEDNNAGTPSVVTTARPNPTQSSVIGFHEGTLFADYKPVAQIYGRICGGSYLASSVNTGDSASFSFDWVRLRTPPPNDLLPAAIPGEFK